MAQVLIVDDDRDLRDFLADFLRLEGYEVETAGSGQEAIERLQTGARPSLIILDLLMPFMDGWQFSDELKGDRAFSSIPVVVLSGVLKTLRHTGTLEASEYLTKPLDLDRLLETVRRHCGSPREGAARDAGETP